VLPTSVTTFCIKHLNIYFSFCQNNTNKGGVQAMKKTLLGIVVGFVLGMFIASTTSFGYAANRPITLMIDGKIVSSDVPPQIINGRLMVPVRVIAESFGATVEWDVSTQTVKITRNNQAPSTPSITPSNESEKQEFLKISKETDDLIAKYEGKLSEQSTLSQSEGDKIYNEIVNMMNKLTAWGELYPYTNIKSLYGNCLTEMGIAIINKSALSTEFANTTFEQKYKNAYSKFQNYKRAIEAEKTRLRKLRYID